MSTLRHKDFGNHVRSLRKEQKLTQEKLAYRSGLSADSIQRLEQGKFSPSLETLEKLCKGFQIKLSTLFRSFEDNNKTDNMKFLEERIFDMLLTIQSTERIKLIIKLISVLNEWIDENEKDNIDW